MATPLHIAIANGYGLSEVERLLALGADPNAVDINERTPLHIAAEKGSDMEIISLLKYGADPNIVTDSEHTPLSYAVCNGWDVEVVRMLISAGGDINCKFKGGSSLLHIAKKPEILRELVSHGLYVDVADELGRTPLQTSLRCYAVPIHRETVAKVRELLRLGANVNVTSSFTNVTPLHIMTSGPQDTKYHLSISEELLRMNADVNLRDKCGRTPLFNTIEYCNTLKKNYENIEVIRLLVSYGSDINTKCGNNSPLEEALLRTDKFWAKLLIRAAIFKNPSEQVIDIEMYKNNFRPNELSTYVKNCIAEVKQMDADYISKMTLSQFLTKYDKRRNLQPLFPKNKYILDKLPSMYPLYKDLILHKLKKCVKRGVFINKLSGIRLTVISKAKREISLNYDCICKIVEFLSNKDLGKLLTACGK